MHGPGNIKFVLCIILFGFSLRSTDILVLVVFVEMTVFLNINRPKNDVVPKFRYSGFSLRRRCCISLCSCTESVLEISRFR
jgi:hypothetical protein